MDRWTVAVIKKELPVLEHRSCSCVPLISHPYNDSSACLLRHCDPFDLLLRTRQEIQQPVYHTSCFMCAHPMIPTNTISKNTLHILNQFYNYYKDYYKDYYILYYIFSILELSNTWLTWIQLLEVAINPELRIEKSVVNCKLEFQTTAQF